MAPLPAAHNDVFLNPLFNADPRGHAVLKAPKALAVNAVLQGPAVNAVLKDPVANAVNVALQDHVVNAVNAARKDPVANADQEAHVVNVEPLDSAAPWVDQANLGLWVHKVLPECLDLPELLVSKVLMVLPDRPVQ